MKREFDVSVLYVEDEVLTREEICVFLRRRVRSIITAGNGSEGLDLYKEHLPDIVITDIRMPVMDGLRMAKKIRELDWNAKIIITTAHSDAPYLFEAIETGIDHYVVKPIETDKLEAAIAKCAENISFRKTARMHQEERERLISELKAALDKVKLLSGFLPICASCKKIRDDRGYWQQIESYIRDHSEAEFSHGICPDCMKKLYPDYMDRDDEGE